MTHNAHAGHEECSRYVDVDAATPRNYVVGGAEEGDISPDDANRERFSHKSNVKVERKVPDNLFSPRKQIR